LTESVTDAVRELDLDHLRALLGHDHAGHRRRDHLSGFDDPDPSERQHRLIVGE